MASRTRRKVERSVARACASSRSGHKSAARCERGCGVPVTARYTSSASAFWVRKARRCLSERTSGGPRRASSNTCFFVLKSLSDDLGNTAMPPYASLACNEASLYKLVRRRIRHHSASSKAHSGKKRQEAHSVARTFARCRDDPMLR